ncbi:hypothetical protein [Ferruginibacter sp.]|nr:hypothetical protein [Ferruginibacter sp.]
MKTLLMVTLFLNALVCTSCNKKQRHQTASIQVTALVDITDPRDVLPDAETLLSFYEFTKDKNIKALFRITATTDKLLNPVAEHHLASGDETEKDNQFDDPDYREKLVLSFYTNVRQAVSAFNTKAQQDTLLGHSECFRSIAGELTRMVENKTDKSLLVVYSDLAENSDLLNVYTKIAPEQIFKHPDSVLQKFEATKLLPRSLSGFTVLFIFQPKNREEDKLFAAMAEMYKKMLSALGAKVIIRSDNPKYLYP